MRPKGMKEKKDIVENWLGMLEFDSCVVSQAVTQLERVPG
jgi:hypothetical protein